jgi:hypothetical protein
MRKLREERTYLDAIPKVELEKGRDQVLFRGPFGRRARSSPQGSCLPACGGRMTTRGRSSRRSMGSAPTSAEVEERSRMS